jgi:hypothetical protein
MEPATSFGPVEAAHAIGSTRTWDATLRQRTEGLTWMMWGIVATAIGLSYALAHETKLVWATGFLWVPWVLVGAAFQTLLWRTVSLTPVGTRLSRSVRVLLGVVALAGLPLLAVGLVRIALGEHGGGIASSVGFTVAVGLAWILVGALVRRLSSRGRRVCIVVGLAIAIVGLLPLASPAVWIVLAAELVVGWAPLLGGLYQALG